MQQVKQIFLLFFVLIFANGFSQEKKIEFTKKLTYELVMKPISEKARHETSKFDFYTNGKESFTIADFNMFPFHFFSDENGTSIVNIGFNNVLKPNYNNPLLMASVFAEGEEVTQKFAASKLNVSETILGIPCNQYILKPVFVDKKESEEGKANLKACIDDRNIINNVPVLSSVYNTLQFHKIQFLTSGLVLKIAAEKKYDEEYLILRSLKDTKDFVYFDNKKSTEKQKKYSDSLKTIYKSKFGINKKGSEETMAIADSAAAVVDSAAVASYEDAFEDVDDYESTYKKPVLEGKLAIENLKPNSLVWKKIPSYCKNLDKDLPRFDNAEIRKHLRNYVGQLCDLYITQSDIESVDEKTTLDEMRREVNYLIENRQKLNKSDRKKLDEYLKNLD